MELFYSELDNGIRLIRLIGRLDGIGVEQIEPMFTTHCTGDGRRVLVDLSELEYIGSAGIRMLTKNSRSLSAHGGRLALLTPSEDVKNILEIVDIPDLIPTYESRESAEAVLLAGSSPPYRDRYQERRTRH